MSNHRIVVIISARNEEKFIGDTIKSLLNQTLPPKKIIVIDDGSTDKTTEVVRSFDKERIVLLERKERIGGPSMLGTPMMALPFNLGFTYLQKKNIKYDFIMISGADCIYEQNYIEIIVKRMIQNKKLVVASGCLKGEEINPDHARGAGRLIKRNFWEQYGERYPYPSYLWESGIIFKAQMLGYEVRGFKDITYSSQRKSGSNIDMIRYGRMLRAIGYPALVVLGRALRLVQKAGARQMVRLLAGYLLKPNQIFPADYEIRNFLKKEYLLKKIKSFFNKEHTKQ